MICKYLLSFIRLPFYFYFFDGFLNLAEFFWFDVALLIDSCFCCLCLWCLIQKILAKTEVKEFIVRDFSLGVVWFQVLHSRL